MWLSGLSLDSISLCLYQVIVHVFDDSSNSYSPSNDTVECPL